MRALTLIFAIFIASTAVFSQTNFETTAAPDQEKIKIAVHDVNSEFYYPTLIEKYYNNDTTLNLEAYRHLYYGYIYQDNYRPLETLNYADSITLTLARNASDSTLSPNILPKLEYFIEKAFFAEPFNMNYLNFMIFIKQSNGDMEAAENYAIKLNMIKNTILSSGTGLTKNSPWHVLYTNDEQDILNSFGIRYSKPIMSSAQIEYFHLPVKHNGNKGYYFDISRRYLKQPAGEAPKASKRFEINPTTNPRSSRFQKYEKY